MTEKDRAKSGSRRLAMIRHAQEVSGNVALTCRYYGITRQTDSLWLRRYATLGEQGLPDRSSKPHLSPSATSEEVVGKTN